MAAGAWSVQQQEVVAGAGAWRLYGGEWGSMRRACLLGGLRVRGRHLIREAAPASAACLDHPPYVSPPPTQLSEGHPLCAVCGRGDLIPDGPLSRGCYDTKVTSASHARRVGWRVTRGVGPAGSCPGGGGGAAERRRRPFNRTSYGYESP